MPVTDPTRISGPHISAVIQDVLDALPPTARALDVGCGPGVPVLSQIAESVEAIGLDISRAVLQQTASNVPRPALIEGDMRTLPLRSDAVDAVLATHSLTHAPTRHHSRILNEFARVCCPQGDLVLVTSEAEWRDPPTVRVPNVGSLDDLRDRLVNRGWIIETAGTAGEGDLQPVHYLHARAPTHGE